MVLLESPARIHGWRPYRGDDGTRGHEGCDSLAEARGSRARLAPAVAFQAPPTVRVDLWGDQGAWRGRGTDSSCPAVGELPRGRSTPSVPGETVLCQEWEYLRVRLLGKP